MKKPKGVIFRILWIVCFLIVQLLWFLLFFIKLTQYPYLSYAVVVLSAMSIIHIKYKQEYTPYKIGWLLTILLWPLLGSFFYLLFRKTTTFEILAKQINTLHDELKLQLPHNGEIIEEIRHQDKGLADIFQYIQHKSAYTAYKNIACEYYAVGDTMYESMLRQVQEAKYFVLIEFFIIEESVMFNKLLQLLRDKATHGVQIRILYDAMGSINRLPLAFDKYIESLHPNIKCTAFNPFVPFLSFVMSARDHRKIVVIDGHTAFTGGINLADEYINIKQKHGHWKDNGVMVKGAAVWNFTEMFIELWNASYTVPEDLLQFKCKDGLEQEGNEGYIQPFSDTPFDRYTVSKDVYTKILDYASQYVYIFTPYLIINHKMKRALISAAQRGVDVRLITPGIPDKKAVFRVTRSNYKTLLKAGVKIYEYTPGFLHSKSYLCDDKIAVVGSANMDPLSLYLDFESSVLMYKVSAIKDLKFDYIETIKLSRQIIH